MIIQLNLNFNDDEIVSHIRQNCYNVRSFSDETILEYVEFFFQTDVSDPKKLSHILENLQYFEE